MPPKKSQSVVFNNDAHKCVSPQSMLVDIQYAFTVNPEDQYQYWGDEDRLNKFCSALNILINRLLGCQIQLYIDISSKGRLHAHGYIKITNLKQFFLFDLRILQKSATYEIDTIQDVLVWEEYCKKIKHIINMVVKTDANQALANLNYRFK